MILESTPTAADEPYAPLHIDQLHDLNRILLDSRPYYYHKGEKTLHESVERAFQISRPADWHQLALEWPHRSLDGRLAYTLDDRAMTAIRVTVTTSGKYLRRHFPGLSDHAIRDIIALERASGCRIITTLDEMVHAVKTGPRSCMTIADAPDADHPYRVYLPKFGWSMAIREDDGHIDGRALIYTDSKGRRMFVRSYRRCEGYSETDHTLEAWMGTQDIFKSESWPTGAKLDLIHARGGCLLMPYIDGGTQGITIKGTHVIIDEDSGLSADSSDGTLDTDADDEDLSTCDDCEERERTDDGTYVGAHGSRWICSSCQDDYHVVIGVHGREYYLHLDEDTVVVVGDCSYDSRYLNSNGIVQLAQDSASAEQYAFSRHCFEFDGEWWSSDDDGVCDRDGELIPECLAQQLHDDTWINADNAIQAHDGTWYAEEDVVLVAGDYYPVVDPLVTLHPKRGWVLTSTLQGSLFEEAA